MKQLEKLTQRFAWRLMPAILLAIVSLTGCKTEPEFPDPGIDMSQSQDVIVSFDSITVYNMQMKVTTPAGLQVLELINANSNTVIEDLSDKYRNQTDFMFEYEVLLPNADTILSYNIRIVDAMSKVINQPFNITVRAGKIPMINVFGGNTKSVVSSKFMLKAKMFAGKSPISRYELVYEGNTELDKKVFDTPVDSHDYEFFCNLPLTVGTSGKLTLSTFDVDDKKTSVDITVHMTTVNYPVRVICEIFRSQQETPHLFYHMYFSYNQDNMVTSIREDMVNGETEGLRRMLTFTYNDKKMVTELKDLQDDTTFTVHKFQYDNEGRFMASSRHDEQDIANPNAKVTVLDRDAKGNVISLLRGATAKLEKIQYETVGEETLLIDYIDNGQNVGNMTRKHLVGNTSVMWPTYNPGLPPFFSEIIDRHFLNLFCYKYIYADRVSTFGMPGSRFEAGDSVAKYTYEVDAKGRLSRVQIEKPLLYREGFWDYDVYTFEYAN